MGADAVVRELLCRCRLTAEVSIVHTTEPVADADAYIVPVGLADELCSARTERPPGPIVVAWGPAELVRTAFALGCDDYLREPWTPEEMEARLDRALSSRRGELRFAGGSYVLRGSTLVRPDATEVRLGGPEAAVLRTLVRGAGQVVSREALGLAAWGRMPAPASRALDVHVSSLRKKMGRDLIRCIRGRGYLLE